MAFILVTSRYTYNGKVSYINIFVSFIFLVSLIYHFLISIKGYTVNDSELTVVRLGWNKTLPLLEIEDVYTDSNVMSGFYNSGTYGLYGVFSYTGRFNKKTGKFNVYATNPAFSVVIKTKKRNYVLTPSKPDVFCNEIMSKVSSK
ncbi:MAG: PH domain-containing protein [Chitinispirillales bacterium]|jgi:hypothetical protein|nr:PH domain-containing protein [Chitinispirillales bacterium]